jgi:hypothetical protein
MDRKVVKVIPLTHANHLANALQYPKVKEYFKKLPEEDTEIKKKQPRCVAIKRV